MDPASDYAPAVTFGGGMPFIAVADQGTSEMARCNKSKHDYKNNGYNGR